MKISTDHKLFYPLLAALLLFCAACNQDPIFYAISQEVKPRLPRVPGTPTAMVLFYRQYENPEGVTERVPVVYIASTTTLNWYAKPESGNPDDADKSWEKEEGDKWWNTAKGKVEQPGGAGNIIGLAVAGDYLYALYQKEIKRIKWDSKPDDEWDDVDSAVADTQEIRFDTIFSSGDRIFIGGRLPQKDKSIPCAILYVDGDGKIQLLKGDTHLLKGVAFNGTSHFLCVNNLYDTGGSIFKLSSPEAADLVEITNSEDATKSNLPFMGIISLEDDPGGPNNTIVAMDRPGMMYTIDDTGDTFTSTKKSIGRSTGALALWRDPAPEEWGTWVPNDPSTLPRPKLLLAGYQGELILTISTGYTNGYFEFDFVWKDGTLDTGADDFHDPGKTGINEITTVDNNERYVSTIGKYPINSFFQTPRDIDENMTLFVSTINEGLWSYRSREGSLQWNAEE
jgi:hypothetical protein